MPNSHENLAQRRWQELTLSEQLGNIGSEVGRAIARQKIGDEKQKNKALDRALDLFDLTLDDKRWHGRMKEIARSREVVCDVFFGDNAYRVPLEKLEKYFFEYATAARLKREIDSAKLGCS